MFSMPGMSGPGGAQQAAPKPTTDSNTIVNINNLIDMNQTECQNADSSSPFVNILQSSDAYSIKSDCDEQLLFNLYFNTPVKIHHMVLRGVTLETSPLNMKLFINRAPMAFDDVESIDPLEEIEIQEGELEGDIILNYVKYQNVSNLTLFIQDNREGGDITEVSKLEIFGAPLHETNMNELKKVGWS